MTKDFCEQQKTCWVAAVYNLQKGLFPIYHVPGSCKWENVVINQSTGTCLKRCIFKMENVLIIALQSDQGTINRIIEMKMSCLFNNSFYY